MVRIGATHSRGAILTVMASLAGFGLFGQAHASEFEFKPSISVSEEYTDNIFQDANIRKSEYTTRVQPGAALHYKTPSLLLDARYSFDFRNFAKNSHGNEYLNNLDLKGTGELVDNFLFLEVTDALHQVATNVSRDVTTESLLVSQTSQNIAAVTPYLLWRPLANETLKTGYRYTDVHYWQGLGFNKREHGVYANLEHQLSAKTVLTAGYTFTHGETEPVLYNRHDISAGFRYSYSDTSNIYGSLGNSWQHFSWGGDTSNPFWDVGVNHDFGGLTGTLETKSQTTEDPLSVSTRQVSYIGQLNKSFDRGAVGLGATYSEFFDTQTGNFTQSALNVPFTVRREILPRLTVAGSLTFSHFKQASAQVNPNELPYRAAAYGSLSYGFHNTDTLLILSYTFQNDRVAPDNAAGDKVTNRVNLELRSVF